MAAADGDRIDRFELYHVEGAAPEAVFPIWVHDHAINALHATLFVVRTRGGLEGVATGPAVGRERSGLGAYIEPFVLGLHPFDVDAAREHLRQSSYLGWRNNWMDVAFWDLAAQACGQPLHRFLGDRLGAPEAARAPTHVPVFACFQEMRSTRARAEAIDRALRLGFGGVELGVHHQTESEDLEHMQAARSAAGDAMLAVHAHQGWSVSLRRAVPRWDGARALRFAERAQALDVAWIQEPLHEEDWDGLEQLSQTAPVPLAGGDLSVSGAQLRHFARSGLFDILTPSCAFAGLGRLEVAMKAALAAGRGFCPMSYSDGVEVVTHIHALCAWARLHPDHQARLAYPWEPPALVPEFRDALLSEPIRLDAAGKVAVPTAPWAGYFHRPGGS